MDIRLTYNPARPYTITVIVPYEDTEQFIPITLSPAEEPVLRRVLSEAGIHVKETP